MLWSQTSRTQGCVYFGICNSGLKIIALEAALAQAKGRAIGLNVDGVTAIVYCELGLPPAAAKGLFCLSRGVGIVAHALEEMQSGERIKGPCPPGDDLVKYVGPADTKIGRAHV